VVKTTPRPLSLQADFSASESSPGDPHYRVCPPIYAIETKYLITQRGEVRLDSPQSLANRLEARILGEGITPSFDIVDAKDAVIVNSRQLPHRAFDAALRDSLLDGQDTPQRIAKFCWLSCHCRMTSWPGNGKSPIE
jgi:hypothetical protein